MSFKIGDKVRRIVQDNTDCKNVYFGVGDIATVTGFDSNPFYSTWPVVTLENGTPFIGGNNPAYLSLVKDKSGSRWARSTLIYKTVKAEMQGKSEWPALRKELIIMLNEAKEKFKSTYDFQPEVKYLSSVIYWGDTVQGFDFWCNWAGKLNCGWMR